jgi:DNA-directed RNA polymerase alpha subunit
MSRRQTYRPDEIRAGHTVFVSYVDVSTPQLRPVVMEFLVTSKRGYWPAEGEWYPYRLRPELLNYIGNHCPFYRTRRAASRKVMADLAMMNRERHA